MGRLGQTEIRGQAGGFALAMELYEGELKTVFCCNEEWSFIANLCLGILRDVGQVLPGHPLGQLSFHADPRGRVHDRRGEKSPTRFVRDRRTLHQ